MIEKLKNSVDMFSCGNNQPQTFYHCGCDLVTNCGITDKTHSMALLFVKFNSGEHLLVIAFFFPRTFRTQCTRLPVTAVHSHRIGLL